LGGAGEQVSRANEQASVRSSHAGLALRVFIGLMLTAGFVIAFVEAKLSQEQFARDSAAVTERLTATEARIARDNAQIVEQLKAAQSQMAQDNAALSSELKTGLDQMTRAIDKASERPTERASEQNLRPKPSRQIVTGTTRPAVRAPQVWALPQTTTKPTNRSKESTAPR
jgi:hypothetical protein